METFENGIYIDGTYFNVPIIKCDRKADFIWKYAERTEDGEHKGELLGVYLNYTLEFGSIVSYQEYNRLYQKLTEAVSYHTVKMPSRTGDMFAFTAYFSRVSDSVRKSVKGKNVFTGLKVEFVSKRPTVTS